MCVWLAFVLMLMIFNHPKSKTFCLASILASKKRRLPPRKRFFFFARKLAKPRVFVLGWWKLSASAQRQATFAEKISGYCHFYGRFNYIYSTTSGVGPHEYVPEGSAKLHAHDAAGCHQEGGIPPSATKRAVHIMGPFYGQNCIINELIKSRITCSLILCGVHCTCAKLCIILLPVVYLFTIIFLLSSIYNR